MWSPKGYLWRMENNQGEWAELREDRLGWQLWSNQGLQNTFANRTGVQFDAQAQALRTLGVMTRFDWPAAQAGRTVTNG
jgi:hypothetical protein